MTPKQILDSFSETLMRDDRILSAPERALLSAIVQHAKGASSASQQTQDSVRSVIASAVGEVVAQRAFAVLGESIVEHILESNTSPIAELANYQTAEILTDPQTPSQSPTPPGVKAPRKQPHHPKREAPLPTDPQTPSGQPLRTPIVTPPATDPQTPSHGITRTVVSKASSAIAERPKNLPARCVVLDEFLSPQELAELTNFAIEHEAEFQTSEVISPASGGGVVNYDHRRSRVLMELGRQQDLMIERIKSVLPQVLQQLEMEQFTVADVEAQITASNDGDFFHFHSDNTSESAASRYLTFVYFFHREPPMFEGGELRIHDAHLEDGVYVSEGSYQTVAPQQNQIVFFPCELMHEITPVKCASQRFADSRFTVNGWLRR
jgi:Rps23 Pro-64 3,4-dihydroxylase Tpa1-like proline 4-hydroxylase